MSRYVSADTVVITRRVGARVVRIVIPLTSEYRWPHCVPSEKILEAYR